MHARSCNPLLLLLALAPGCVQLRYDRRVALYEPAAAEVAELVPGESDLTDCLERLGAPLGVFEIPDGMAVSYGWQRQRSWRFQISVPLAKHLSGSLSYTDDGEDIPAILCLFDDACRLTEIRSGTLRQLTARLGRRRPQLMEGDA